MDVKLVMFKTDGQRKDFPIVNPTTVIGRGENCDLRVPLLSISRRHCELVLGGDTVTVRDVASSNGTFVNNSRVTEAPLNAGDRLVIGPIVFTVQIDGSPAEIRPVKTEAQQMGAAGEGGGDQIVELEDDIVAQPGASALMEPSATATPPVELEVDDESSDDPIAALEALAADTEDEDEEKDEQDRQE